MGNILIAVGIVLVLVAIAYDYGFLGWFGNLAPDFKKEGENFSFYAPIGSMIVVSLLLSLLMRLFGK